MSDPQFERSVPSTPPSAHKPLPTVDPHAVLHRHVHAGVPAEEMSGKEMFALIELLRQRHGSEGEALEASLLKVRRMPDKKLQLVEWARAREAAPPQLQAQQPQVQDHHPQLQAPHPQHHHATDTGTHPDSSPGYNPHPNPHPSAHARAHVRSSPRSSPRALCAVTAAATNAGVRAELDARALIGELVEGRAASSVSLAEVHAVVAHLKRSGDGAELEERLMRTRLGQDKKEMLVAHLKKRAQQGLHTNAPARTHTHTNTDARALGGAHAHVDAHALDHERARELATGPGMRRSLAHEERLDPHASLPLPEGGSPLVVRTQGGARPSVQLRQQLASLEHTLARMEDSYNFAVECWQADMKLVREQIHAIRSAVATIAA